ncbi:mRNA 3' end processing factor, variant 2 [Batrachochytrium dendrobatidis]|nr:mRNA 3' end processing factor, variant 2 [Batrachochytrium dendrobatidis]
MPMIPSTAVENSTAVPVPDTATLLAVYQEFRTSLGDLTFNSKPIITNLTIIAQENINSSSAIVHAVEERIKNSQPKHRVPTIYLMDSIIKNVGGIYRTLFAKNIVSVFSDAYSAVDQADQLRLQKLVRTWATYPSGPLFSATKLSVLERLCAKAGSGTSNESGATEKAVSAASLKKPFKGATVVSAKINSATRDMPTAPLADKSASKEVPVLGPNGSTTLLVQQQIGFLLQKKRAAAVIYPNDTSASQQIQVLEQLLNVILTTQLDPQTINQITLQIQSMMTAPIPPVSSAPDLNPSNVPPSLSAPVAIPRVSTPLINTPAAGAFVATSFQPAPVYTSHSGPAFVPSIVRPPQRVQSDSLQALPQIDLAMLSQLVTSSGLSANLNTAALNLPRGAGIPSSLLSAQTSGFTSKNIFPSQFPSTSSGAFVRPPISTHILQPLPQNLPSVPLAFSGLTLPTKPTLKVTLAHKDIQCVHPNAVYSLYDGLPLQCKQCALRYAKLPNGDQRMAAHLDWHFRQNRRLRESSKRTISRDWYTSVDGWVDERYGQEQDTQAIVSVFGEVDSGKKSPTQAVVPTLSADGFQDPKCVVCCEPFEKFFDQDGDMWMLRNAVLVDEKLYHQECLDQETTFTLNAGSKRKADDETDTKAANALTENFKKSKV